MHVMYELPALLESWIGNAWDLFGYESKFPRMLMSCSYRRQFGSIGFNLFRF